MTTLEPILAAHPFFKEFTPAHLQLLIGCASNVVFDAGDYLLREGREANLFYLIRQGHVSLEIAVPGRTPLVLQTVSDGDILGWSWLIPPYHWTFDARAIESVRALALDGACLRRKCEEDHDLGYAMLKRFAHIMDQRLQATRLQLMDVYGSTMTAIPSANATSKTRSPRKSPKILKNSKMPAMPKPAKRKAGKRG